MNRLARETPINGDKWISIHDMHLSQIKCKSSSVIFCFKDGFNLIENGRLLKTGSGCIELIGCNSSDFSCNVIKRIVSKQGTRLYGRPISLEKLNKMLVSKKNHVEVFLELYDYNHLYWRGEISPFKRLFKRQLAPIITIEAMNFFPMIYLWKDVQKND